MATLTKKRRALLSYIRLPDEAEAAIEKAIAMSRERNEEYYAAHPESERLPDSMYEEIRLQFRLTTLSSKGLL